MSTGHLPPGTPLFPYTTLFRSREAARPGVEAHDQVDRDRADAVEVGPVLAFRSSGARLGGFRCGSRALVDGRSEEHTSELQSLRHLVCRLLLEKKKSPDWKCRG